MIEHKSLNPEFDNCCWTKVMHQMTSQSASFYYFKYRINGVVYTRPAEEFQTAWNQARCWEKLSNE